MGASYSREYAIRFWAHQFEEHMDIIRDLSQRAGLRVGANVYRLRAQWAKIHQDASLLTARVVQESDMAVRDALETAREHGIPCVPDLYAHMLEESEYFQQAILGDRFDLGSEMQWWAREHAENLDFVNCQLPVLIAEDSRRRTVPPAVKEAMAKNQKISAQFKRVLANGGGKQGLERLMEAKKEHAAAVESLMSNLDSLPLKAKTRESVRKMLHHEKHEAEFAELRLKTVAHMDRSSQPR